jgi:hypothetical protein
VLLRQSADGAVVLPAALADIHNRLGTDTRLESKGGVPDIGNWTKAPSWVKGAFVIDQPVAFAVSAEAAVQDAESKAELVVGGTTLPVTFVATGGYDAFGPQRLGRVKIDKAGTYSVQIRPVQNAWKPVNVRSVTLRPLSAYQTETN